MLFNDIKNKQQKLIALKLIYVKNFNFGVH